MHWIILGSVVYVFIVIVVCLRIIYDTRSTDKALAYVLIAVLVPVVGIIIYFTVGQNYRKDKLYSKKIINDTKILAELRERITLESEKAWNTPETAVQKHKKLA